MEKRRNPNLTRIWLLVPKVFLQRFDTAIEGLFPSRSEAIRRGMNLILQEVRRSKEDEPPRSKAPTLDAVSPPLTS